MQALCFATSGWWQEEELGKERKHRWRPSLPRTGKEPTAGGWAGDSASLGRSSQLYRAVDTVGKGE